MKDLSRNKISSHIEKSSQLKNFKNYINGQFLSKRIPSKTAFKNVIKTVEKFYHKVTISIIPLKYIKGTDSGIRTKSFSEKIVK